GRAPGGAGHIGEPAIAEILIQNIGAVIGDQQINVAIVVVISRADALSPAFFCESGLSGYQGEVAFTVVAVQLRKAWRARAGAVESRTVGDKDVICAVAIVIEDSDA